MPKYMSPLAEYADLYGDKLFAFTTAQPDIKAQIFEAFGKFINVYSSVEAILHVLFRHYSGMGEEKGRIVSAGSRLSDLIGWIKALAVKNERPQTEIEELENLFGQFDVITKFRGLIVHRGGRIEGDELVTSNSLISKHIEQSKVIKSKRSDIEAATFDLSLIHFRIALLIPHVRRIAVPDDRLKPESVLSEPWLYKHREPSSLLAEMLKTHE